MNEIINNLEQISISQSQRGGKLLIYKNFEYKIDYIAKSTNKHTWRCNQDPACKARCYTIGLDPPVTESEHSHIHPAKPAKIEIRQAINKVKEMAKSNQKSMRFIIQHSQTNLSKEAQALLPSYDALRLRIYNSKENPYAHLPKPTSLGDICIPEEFQYTCKNELFLLHDTGNNDSERIIVFATEKNIQLLNNNPNWYVDGTFAVAPGLFYQLFTVHVLIKGKNLPCVYALLPNKTQKSYERLFEYLKSLIEIEPQTVGLDFEQAIINSVENTFEECTPLGCFFHFKQRLWRRIQELGFATAYNQIDTVRVFFKKVACIAFVPVHDIATVYNQLKESEEILFKTYHSFFKYFESTYIGELKRGKGVGRKEPKYPHAIWSVYERNCDDLPRSNNKIEGWHNALQRIIDKSHVIYSFIDGIKLEQSNTELLQTQIKTRRVPKRKAVYILLDNRIKELIISYSKNNAMEYLENLSLIIDN
ncbi:hypothetical protein BpHYR1_014380 [Brachionus plicatilis]|uniref:MULE transposase domain-containing protein n=1 Tax=Brachionus plicatilis TaxID=10195 RepID=A0A3M7RLP0_BRAPC|nr:hypothetical protein BpHYR1_014380 [Brachionus plicatilis]